ncbi:MAG: HypC/HybG/HupF family hydrogenase formation chaperone [Parcubacteria group bacterium]|jgi:hydrogenase maturation factor
MCLTIPKKVVAVGKEIFIVETFDGTRQEVKSIVELSVGDFCITQQNVVIQKMTDEDAKEIFEITKNGG